MATLLVLAIAFVGFGAPAGLAAASESVTIQSFSFMPASLSVNVGDTVTWTNQQTGVPHTVTADNGSFGSSVLMAGQSFSMTFSQPGTFTYHCMIHPNMHGTITVMAAATSQPATSPPATSPPATSQPTAQPAAAQPSAQPAPAASAAMTVHFSAGYDLIGVPAGTVLSANPISGFDPSTNSYQPLAAGQTPLGGAGYWAFFAADAEVALPSGSNAPLTVAAPAGAWLLVGNPSGTQAATITGADAAWKYSASAGTYVAATTLNPGEGAWVLSRQGGSITVAPGGLPAPAPTAVPTQASTPVTQPAMQSTPYVPPSQMMPSPYRGPYGY